MTNTTTTLINTMTATTITTAAVVTRCMQTIMQVAKSLFLEVMFFGFIPPHKDKCHCYNKSYNNGHYKN